MEKITYAGWQNCYRLANDWVDLVVTGDVGPRVLRFGFVGEANEFIEIDSNLGKTGGDEWRMYGGHRLWHAPEMLGRTAIPDNNPVQVTATPEGLRVCQPTEPLTGIKKEMVIALTPDEPNVTVIHRLYNRGLWPLELAPWALSVMTSGGTAILPLPPRGAHDDHLEPTSTIALWAYTDLTDPRWTWGKQYIFLRQDERVRQPQKLGIANPEGWIAYANHGNLFVKTTNYVPNATYPDHGCSAEVYTEGHLIELETLAPLTRLAPGAYVEHIERWFLFRDVPLPRSDADVDQTILPLVNSLN